MNGWTLEYVRSLAVSDYEELVAWLIEEAEARERKDDRDADDDDSFE